MSLNPQKEDMEPKVKHPKVRLKKNKSLRVK